MCLILITISFILFIVSSVILVFVASLGNILSWGLMLLIITIPAFALIFAILFLCIGIQVFLSSSKIKHH
jgi:hypothetical protein